MLMKSYLIKNKMYVQKKIDHNIIREMISMCIIEHDLPFPFVEYRRVRELLKYLNPDYKFINRDTVEADVCKFHEIQKEKLKVALARIPSRVCLTSDIWNACTSEGCLCLTANYVDENWILNSKILSFCSISPLDSGIELARKIFDCLKDWGIEKKIFSLTLDNATDNDMQEILKERLCLNNSLLCNGEFFHVSCSANILNLIVEEGLKVISSTLHKIRESVKYVNWYDETMKAFEKCVANVGVKREVGLSLDVPTQWRSTYIMLENAIRHRRAFSNLQLIDENYKYCPSHEEWVRGENIRKFLKPFNDIAHLISGSSYSTSNTYFMLIWKIGCLLKDNLVNEDEMIKDMATRMNIKFGKYWNDYSVILAMGFVLDPRLKFSLLEYCYNKLDPDTCQEKLDYVKRKLYTLFEQYKKKSTSEASSSSANTCQHDNNLKRKRESSSVYDEFIAYENQIAAEKGLSSLDMYLQERKLEIKFFPEMDVLQYWKNQRKRFGDLASMACDVLSIPITTVASESAFSIGAEMLNKYRSCTIPKHVQAILCTRNWIHGYNSSNIDGEKQGERENDGSAVSAADSNIL